MSTEDSVHVIFRPYGQAWPFSGSNFTGLDRTGVLQGGSIDHTSLPHRLVIHLVLINTPPPTNYYYDHKSDCQATPLKLTNRTKEL